MSGDGDGDGETMDHLLIASIAVFIGSIVEGILGFGCSLVWMSFFPLFTSVQDAVGVLQPMHIALNLFILINLWKSCTPSELKPLAMTAPFGIIFGLWIVTSWSSNAIDCVLGIFLIVYTMIKSNDNGDEKDNNKNNKIVHDHGDIICKEAAAVGVIKNKGPIKRKQSDLELKPILDETDFPDEEEKKDGDSYHSPNSNSNSNSSKQFHPDSPIATNIPHAELKLSSPLTHRHHSGENMPAIPNLNNHHPTTKTTTTLKTSSTSSSNNNKKLSVLALSNNQKMIRNPTAIAAGFVGGALMGAFGTGGPAFLIYAKEAGWQKHPELFRANMQLLFFVINVPVCFSQYVEGIITFERCKASFYLLPALMLGGHIGGILATKVPRDKFQLLVVNGLRIMGVMFLIEATR
jgi:uncharacterized membrane protein YfcA